MIDYYKRMMNDDSLSETDRATYRKMYEMAMSKEETARLKAELAKQKERDEAVAEKEDDSCAGGACKI